MEIQKNTLIRNKTYTYLLPCLKYYEDEDYKRIINSFYILSVGLNDINQYVKKNCIHILYNLSPKLSYNEHKEYNMQFSQFLDWVRIKGYFIDDYLFNCNNNQAHMVVIKVPNEHNSTYEEFLAGKYSKMYNNYYIYKYFNNIKISSNPILENNINHRLENTRNVLLKHSKGKEAFVHAVNTHFDTDMQINEFNGELDYPLKLEEEIFNY